MEEITPRPRAEKPSKTVGGVKSQLESNSVPAREAQRAQTKLMHPRTQGPHRD